MSSGSVICLREMKQVKPHNLTLRIAACEDHKTIHEVQVINTEGLEDATLLLFCPQVTHGQMSPVELDPSSQIGTLSLSLSDPHWRYKLRGMVLEEMTQFLCCSN